MAKRIINKPVLPRMANHLQCSKLPLAAFTENNPHNKNQEFQALNSRGPQVISSKATQCLKEALLCRASDRQPPGDVCLAEKMLGGALLGLQRGRLYHRTPYSGDPIQWGSCWFLRIPCGFLGLLPGFLRFSWTTTTLGKSCEGRFGLCGLLLFWGSLVHHRSVGVWQYLGSH